MSHRLDAFQAYKVGRVYNDAQVAHDGPRAACQVRSYRRKDVATMKSCTDVLQVIGWIREQNGCMCGLFGDYIAKESIVGTNEEPFTGMEGNGSTRAADAGVYHAHKDRVGGEIAVGGGQNPRAGGDTLWRDVVGEIDDAYIGRNAGNHAFHYADIRFTGAKVGH